MKISASSRSVVSLITIPDYHLCKGLHTDVEDINPCTKTAFMVSASSKTAVTKLAGAFSVG